MDKSKFNNKKEWRKFGFGLSAILFIIATIQILFGNAIFPYFYGACVVILLIGIVAPILIKPIFILFSFIGFGIGWFMTRLILIVLYYLIFTLIAFIARIFGKDFLDLKFNRESDSYWIPRNPYSKKNYEKMF